MRTIHQYLWLDDRHDVRFLAKRGVACKRMRICLYREATWDVLTDVDDSTPFRKARSQGVILGQSFAQTIQSFSDRLFWKARKRLRAKIDFDARDDSQLGQILRKRHALC